MPTKFRANSSRFDLRTTTLLSLLILSMSGCGGGGGDEDSGSDGGSDGPTTGSVFQLAGNADNSGSALVAIEVPAGTTKFGLTVESSADAVRMESVRAGGTTFFSSTGERVGLAQFFQPESSYANVPSRGNDPRLTSTSFILDVSLANQRSDGSLVDAQGAPFTVTVNTKADPNLNSGTLTVNIFSVGEIARTSGIRAAIQSAMESMKQIYADESGIAVTFNEFTISGGNLLPDPFNGSNFYRAATAGAPAPAVNLFLAGDVLGLEGDVLGIAGSIPGSPNSTSRSAVLVSLLTSAGADGVFDEADLRLLGETFAHECGHYLGLFHPVDFNSVTGTAAASDPLSDTPDCSTQSQCLANSSLIRNLMYSTPVVNISGEGIPQNQLTEQQRAVMNRYIAVD